MRFIEHHKHHWKQSGLYSSIQKHKPAINHQPIIALAVSDLLCETVDMALASATLIIGRWAFGNALCQFQGLINMFTSNVTPATLGLTAINRYVKIVKTSHYKKIFSPRNHQPVYHCFSCQRSAVWNSTDVVNFCHADHRKIGLWRRPMPI